MTPINYKLLNLLNSFTANEIKEFKKFISSGLYTSGRNYLPLINYLLKCKSKDPGKISNGEKFLKLNSDKKFSKQTLKNRFSELYKLGEEFLIYLSLKNNNLDALILKADSLDISGTKDALEVTDLVIKADSDNPDIWFARGLALGENDP